MNEQIFYPQVWGDFPSLYSRFYKVIMFESTNVTNEGKKHKCNSRC
jgi:hypothetical protein